MPDQTASGPIFPEEGTFPATCSRCGGRVSEPVLYCPHCGVHARFAFGERVRGEGARAARHASPAPEADGGSKGQGDDLRHDDRLWPKPPKPLFAAPRGGTYGEFGAPSMSSGGARQWGLKGGTGLTLLAFVVLYGGIVLLQRNEQSSSEAQLGTSSIVQGSVVANQPHTSAHVAVPAVVPHSPGNASVASEHKASQPRKPAAPIVATAPSPDVVAPSASPSASSSASASLPSSQQPAVADTARSSSPPQSMAAQAKSPASQPQSMAAQAPPPTSQSHPIDASVRAPTPPAQPLGTRASPSRAWNGRGTMSPLDYLSARGPSPTTHAPPPPEEQQPVSRHDRGRDSAALSSSSPSLAAARAALDRNDLGAARAALASQPNTGQGYMLRQDLASREKSRDALLSAARACVVQERWTCAWHNAGNALSIDSSSVEAKALIERSIVDSGAASTPPGPGPGPDVPEVQ